MALFKKPAPVIPAPPPECEHKYKDFKWYLESSYYPYEKAYAIKVIEPYVCVHCKKRIDKILWNFESHGTKNDADRMKEAIIEKYGDEIDDRVKIEDEIADMQLVDREYLKFYELVKNGKINPLELKL